MPTRSVSETRESVVSIRQYPFKIPVNDPEVVKVGRPGHDSRELKVVEGRESRVRGEERED